MRLLRILLRKIRTRVRAAFAQDWLVHALCERNPDETQLALQLRSLEKESLRLRLESAVRSMKDWPARALNEADAAN